MFLMISAHDSIALYLGLNLKVHVYIVATLKRRWILLIEAGL